MKRFADFLENQGYEYTGSTSIVYRAIDDHAEYTEWVHDADRFDLDFDPDYWSFGRFDNMMVDGIEDYWEEV